MLKLNEIEIAYPQSPALVSLAEKLKSGLASYRIPSSVVKKTGIKSLADVKEPWLIVLCAPETPSCGEVTDRILEFRSKRLYDHILTLLVSGEPAESFPKELLFETLPDGRVVSREPLAANIAAESERESLKLLSVEKLRLLAPILGVSFDELRNRRLRSRLRVAAALSAVALIGAAVFLSYALSRWRVISAQNEDLSLELAQAEEARDLAREQRDAAREGFAATTAIRARDALDSGDSELAMLLCLEFLPDYGLSSGLPEILEEALDGLCRQGYVPVTSLKEYVKTRYQRGPDKAKESEEGAFPQTITRPMPEGYDNGRESFELKLKISSEEFGYAVYHGSFYANRTSGDTIYRDLICFRDGRPEYYMPGSQFAGRWLDACLILYDGSFIGTEYIYPEYSAFRYDPFWAEFIPFYDEPEEGAFEAAELPADPAACEEAGIYAGEAPGSPAEGTVAEHAIACGIKTFEEPDGMPGLIIGRTRTNTSSNYGLDDEDVKIHVFSKGPFRYLYTIEDAVALFRPHDSAFFLANTGKKLMVFSASPFRYLYTLEDKFTRELREDNYQIPFFPDGREWLYVKCASDVGKAVYDLAAGRLIAAFDVKGQTYNFEIAADGTVLTSVNNMPVIWDPASDTVIREIEGEEESPELMGDIDAKAGRRSAGAVRVYDRVYVYRDAPAEVPDSLEERIALAKELLNGRVLTKMERKTYGLTQEGGAE